MLKDAKHAKLIKYLEQLKPNRRKKMARGHLQIRPTLCIIHRNDLRIAKRPEWLRTEQKSLAPTEVQLCLSRTPAGAPSEPLASRSRGGRCGTYCHAINVGFTVAIKPRSIFWGSKPLCSPLCSSESSVGKWAKVESNSWSSKGTESRLLLTMCMQMQAANRP